MAIKNYKPTTPSRRNMSVTDYSGLSKVAPERAFSHQSRRLQVETATEELRFATEAAVTVKNIVSSTLSVRSLM